MHKNPEIVRRDYHAFNTADTKTLTDLFDDGGGKRLDVGCCIAFEFKRGRVIDGREHFYDLHAWDAFWS